MNGVANAALGAVIIIKVEAANTLPLFMGLPDLWMGTQNYISTHIFSVNRVSTTAVAGAMPLFYWPLRL